jgi:hypothetical protein
LTTDAPLDRPLDRRFLIRGGAVLAGAAGVTAIGAAIAPSTADAADGGNVVLGTSNAAGSTTSITIDGTTGGGDAALALNNANGPSLALQPLPQDWDGELGVGEIANTEVGPNIGVDYGDGPATTFLATGVDLTNTYPVPAERLLDTRSAASRSGAVVGSSAAPFDAAGRLKGGAYIDVAVASVEDVALVGVFLNLTAFESTAGGFLEIYTPGTRSNRPTLRFPRNVAVANHAFIGPGTSKGFYTVRIYASQPTQVLLDLVGAVTGFPPSGTATTAAAPARRLLGRQAKQRDRLVKSIRSSR